MSSNRIIASPLAHHLSNQAQIDLSQVTGSGPHGRIIKRDIDAVLRGENHPRLASADTTTNHSNTAIKPPLTDARAFYASDDYDEQKLDSMRAAIATRLSQSTQQIPHIYLTRRLSLDALLAYRATINPQLEDSGEKISINDLVLKAAALALMEVPEVNVSFADDAILHHHHADIGVAVALPNGLITPIIRKCDEKSIRQIALEVKDMAARAAEKRLKPHEYEGGSFSISNLGMFGIEQFTAVINPPQAAILAVGCATTDWHNVNGNMVSQQMMRVTLSCDHRAIDGAVGAQFLAALAAYIENPLLLTI